MNRCLLNHQALDVITDDAAYWIGFLFADGSVIRERQSAPAIQVRLSEVDRGQIAKLREFLGSTHTIGYCPPGNYGGYSSRASFRLSVRSERLAHRLLDLGRYEGPIARELVSSRHFWRGVVDGDGSVYISKLGYAVFGLVGSRRMLEAFRGFLKERGLAGRMSIRPTKSIYIINTAGNLAARIIEELYKDAVVALDRKAAAARPIIESVRIARARAQADAAELRQRYEAGATLVELGRYFGVSDVAILNRMRKAGIPRRPPGSRKKAGPQTSWGTDRLSPE